MPRSTDTKAMEMKRGEEPVVQMSLRVPVDLHRQWKIKAAERGMSMQALLVSVLVPVLRAKG